MTTKTTKSKRVVKSKDIKIPLFLLYATPISAAILWLVSKSTEVVLFSWINALLSILLFISSIVMLSIHNGWIKFEYKSKSKVKTKEE